MTLLSASPKNNVIGNEKEYLLCSRFMSTMEETEGEEVERHGEEELVRQGAKEQEFEQAVNNSGEYEKCGESPYTDGVGNANDEELNGRGNVNDHEGNGGNCDILPKLDGSCGLTESMGDISGKTSVHI